MLPLFLYSRQRYYYMFKVIASKVASFGFPAQRSSLGMFPPSVMAHRPAGSFKHFIMISSLIQFLMYGPALFFFLLLFSTVFLMGFKFHTGIPAHPICLPPGQNPGRSHSSGTVPLWITYLVFPEYSKSMGCHRRNIK